MNKLDTTKNIQDVLKNATPDLEKTPVTTQIAGANVTGTKFSSESLNVHSASVFMTKDGLVIKDMGSKDDAIVLFAGLIDDESFLQPYNNASA